MASVPVAAGRQRPGTLIVNVPKRFLRRAVERNAVRRVAREAWRASGLHVEPVDLLVRVHASPWTAAGHAAPSRSGTMTAGGARPRTVSAPSASGRPAAGGADRSAKRAPGAGLPGLKRAVRNELDPLFARARASLHKPGNTRRNAR